MKQVVNRLKSMIARGVIHLVNDEAGRQFCQITVMDGEPKKDVDRVQMWGFSGVPMPGSSAIVLFLGSDRNKPIVIGDNHPEYRPKEGVPGESIQYDAIGQYIYLQEDGSIEIQTNGLLTIKSADKVRIETDLLECTGEIKDRCDGDGVSMSLMRAWGDTHVHPENDAGGPTDPPNTLMGGH